MATNIAMFSYDLANMMFVGIDNNATQLAARYGNFDAWVSRPGDIPKPTLKSFPEPNELRFRSVARTQHRRVYSMVEQNIYAWDFSLQSPLEWTYAGKVDAAG